MSENADQPIDQGMLEAMAEKLEFDGVFDEMNKEHRAGLEADDEWSKPEYIHVSYLVQAFAHGVLTADPWHHGYRIPPNFDAVLNWIAFCVQDEFGTDEVVKLSLIEIEDRFWKWANQNPHFLAWNEPKEPGTVVAVTTRYSSTPDERDFIDLHALVRNASVHIRDQRRRERDFEEKFGKEQKQLEKRRTDNG